MAEGETSSTSCYTSIVQRTLPSRYQALSTLPTGKGEARPHTAEKVEKGWAGFTNYDPPLSPTSLLFCAAAR